ncbi:glycosyltransferase [uncultured Nocardioides sp.]|uniref:glycosyltransferase n=1 Tax=uncultured Nocardioides sp. TaxID=198441 RepID=UPI0025D6C78E|nr:glycosyltransferase [uncultured Nocardioides sp.]
MTPPLVIALAGTDHHPFDRMVDWIDAAAARRKDVRFVVQHGATRPPQVAEGHAFLAHDRLVALVAEAAVVVCHGGPGTITDARAAGHVPLCMPRDPRLGEHVDGHQQRFASFAGASGVVQVVSSVESFHDTLEDALVPGRLVHAAATTSRLRDEARARAAAELDEVLALRSRRLRRLLRNAR